MYRTQKWSWKRMVVNIMSRGRYGAAPFAKTPRTQETLTEHWNKRQYTHKDMILKKYYYNKLKTNLCWFMSIKMVVGKRAKY